MLWLPLNLKQLEKTHPKPSDKSFAAVLAAFLAIVGFFFIFTWGMIFLLISIVICFIGLMRPSALGSVHQFWHRFGLFLGWLLSPIFLMILYYLFLTPAAVILKIFGHQALSPSGRWKVRQKATRFERIF